jgi:hypothetical protein
MDFGEGPGTAAYFAPSSLIATAAGSAEEVTLPTRSLLPLGDIFTDWMPDTIRT